MHQDVTALQIRHCQSEGELRAGSIHSAQGEREHPAGKLQGSPQNHRVEGERDQAHPFFHR